MSKKTLKFALAMMAVFCLVMFVTACTYMKDKDPERLSDSELSLKYPNSVKMDPDSVNHIKVGQIIFISLAENQSIPYRWEPVISDENLIRLFDDEINSDKVDENAGEGAPGAVHIFYFEALNAGEGSIDMEWIFLSDSRSEGDALSYTIVIEDS
ncbi:MAG: protease inhibitor I42 family protein [Peptococcaceae bacterium]|nr:protease inhibitor I42 family protein [Peptococcaceae bacterium]